jgi:hypothetical protein
LALSPEVRRSKPRSKEAKSAPQESDSPTPVETGNAILDSLFNDELVDSEMYNQEILRIVKNHLATRDLTSSAGAQLGEDLIKLAESGGT